MGVEIASRAPAEWPDGIFASSDVVALGLLQGLTEGPRPIRVPSEIALVGYYDTDFAKSAVVPLTSVRHPGVTIGATAVELLLAEASDRDRPKQQVVYRPEIVERASTGAPLRRVVSGLSMA